MSTHTPDDEELQDEMEQARIEFERWRQIHRPRICREPLLREEYEGKWDGLKRDAQTERDQELGEVE